MFCVPARFLYQGLSVGTRKAEVVNSLTMKITANESDINDIFDNSCYHHQCIAKSSVYCTICNALMMITGVIETFAICRWYRFHWPWFSLLSFSFELKNERREKMCFCVDRSNHRIKSNFVAFKMKNATAYEQNIWRVISANATVLAHFGYYTDEKESIVQIFWGSYFQRLTTFIQKFCFVDIVWNHLTCTLCLKSARSGAAKATPLPLQQLTRKAVGWLETRLLYTNNNA